MYGREDMCGQALKWVKHVIFQLINVVIWIDVWYVMEH